MKTTLFPIPRLGAPGLGLALLVLITANGFAQQGPNWCCPQSTCPNLVTNGDFHLGNTLFTSSYGNVTAPPASALVPGKYTIVNGNLAHAICSNWQITDHTACIGTAGNMMIVNGMTGTSANAVIWRQTVTIGPGQAGTANRTYRFCAYAKHLKACCFDVTPTLTMRITANPGNMVTNSAPFTLTGNSGACVWDLLSVNVTVPATVTSLTLDIILPPRPPGDGGDFALDDISLHLAQPVNSAYMSFSVLTNAPTAANPNATVTATYTGPALGAGCQYQWTVCEIINGNQVNMVTTPPASWTSPSPSTQFVGYQGNSATLSGSAVGKFPPGKEYRVFLKVWCGECTVETICWQPAGWHTALRKAISGPTRMLDRKEPGPWTPPGKLNTGTQPNSQRPTEEPPMAPTRPRTPPGKPGE